MAIELNQTTSSEIAAALLTERRKAGSPAMGMVMTFVIVTDESDHYDSLRVARTVSREHPSRILAVILRSNRGQPALDAEVSIGGSGENVLLRLSGELSKHAASVVLPLLLPDSPVVAWWPRKAPDDTAADPIGLLAQRRITDSATDSRGRTAAILTQATHYSPGNTDLAWTRLTPWRALLAAAMDQYPARIRSARVEAERSNPSADLMVAWLTDRLGVDVARAFSRGPGLTSVQMETGGGAIELCRPDGLLAEFSIPNAPNRPVALKRRETAELLAEELRRLDPDEIYEEAVQTLCRLADREAPNVHAPRRTTASETAKHSQAALSTPSRQSGRSARKASSQRQSAGGAQTSAGSPSAAKSAAGKKATAKRSSTTKRSSATNATKKPTAKRSNATKATTKKAAGTRTRSARRGG
ncbi:MAG: glucose-6-phosphate dehydrogenase assembly protein OpcA [Nocardioidaceae bacterium]